MSLYLKLIMNVKTREQCKFAKNVFENICIPSGLQRAVIA